MKEEGLREFESRKKLYDIYQNQKNEITKQKEKMKKLMRDILTSQMKEKNKSK
jgi:hypothetical protein